MLYDGLLGNIKGNTTETQLNLLLQILVVESLEKLQNYRSERTTSHMAQIKFYRNMYEDMHPNEQVWFGVTSFELEGEVNRMTFWKNKKPLIKNYLLEANQNPDRRGKRPWTYYNTTPLGKVLAMKYWYKKNEPREIKMKMGRMVKIVDFKPTELLNSFFEYLPKLKQYSKTIKESSTELELNDALKYAFPEIDINFRGVTKKVGIEVNFRFSNQKHVQIIKYFRLDDPDDVKEQWQAKEMYDYILDSLTYLFLANLEATQTELGVENPVIAKILEDPSLKSFRQQYKMERQQDLQESLNFLSDDN